MAVNRTPRYSKIVYLWFQVFFYSCIITLVLALLGCNVDLGIKEIIKMSMPVVFLNCKTGPVHNCQKRHNGDRAM